MTIEFTSDELELVEELVEERVAALGPEIHHTSSRSYRERLENERKILRKLLERMTSVAA